MTENMKRFMELVSANRELANRLNSAPEDEIIAMAKSLGVALTAADFERRDGGLSDDELDAVSGGGVCACVLGGGGAEDKSDKTCACVLGGGGEDRNGWARCVCIMGGNGKDNRAMED